MLLSNWRSMAFTKCFVTGCFSKYLDGLWSINMNQSDLRVDGLPNVAAVWVNYFLLVTVKRQQTVSTPTTNNDTLGRHLCATCKKYWDTVPNLAVKGTYKVLALQTPPPPFSKLVTIGNHVEIFWGTTLKRGEGCVPSGMCDLKHCLVWRTDF